MQMSGSGLQQGAAYFPHTFESTSGRCCASLQDKETVLSWRASTPEITYLHNHISPTKEQPANTSFRSNETTFREGNSLNCVLYLEY